MKSFLLLLSTSILVLSLNAPAQTNPPVRPNPSARALEGLGFNVLTAEQRASLAPLAQEHRGKIDELQEKIRAGRKTLVETAIGRPFDEAAVRQQAQSVANLEAEIGVIRLKILSKVQPPLSPEQVEKLKAASPAAPAQNYRLPENRPGRQRILQNSSRDPNGLPPKP